uniref:Uncharacterized protein n=1 Tax=Phlebotomus papatasi TaxID=29031 RepID=A0A1B0DFT2_PHLPP
MDTDFEKKLYAYGLNTATVDYLKGEGIDRFVFFEIQPLHLQRTPIRLRDQLLICRMIRLAKEKAHRDEFHQTPSLMNDLRKRREETVKGFKEKFVKMVSFQQVRVDSLRTDSAEKAVDQISVDEPQNVKDNESDKEDLTEVPDEVSVTSETSDMALGAPKRTAFTYFIYVLYFLLWATCYAIAIELQFGVVFFLFSALGAVYLNTRTRPKQPGEISAYSVFNKDCHAIDGTLKAEQFEAELRYAAIK